MGACFSSILLRPLHLKAARERKTKGYSALNTNLQLFFFSPCTFLSPSFLVPFLPASFSSILRLLHSKTASDRTTRVTVTKIRTFNFSSLFILHLPSFLLSFPISPCLFLPSASLLLLPLLPLLPQAVQRSVDSPNKGELGPQVSGALKSNSLWLLGRARRRPLFVGGSACSQAD